MSVSWASHHRGVGNTNIFKLEALRLLKSAFFWLTDSISSFQLFQCCHFFLQFSSQKEIHSMISASLSINFTALEFKVCSSGLKNGFKFVMSSPAACYRSSCRSVCFKKKNYRWGFLHSSFISKTTTTGSLHLQLQKQIDYWVIPLQNYISY